MASVQTSTVSPCVANSEPAVSNFAAQDILLRLKKTYLPELRSLYSDCNWLRNNLDIDGTRELQPNEVKLLQFVGLVDSVVQEIIALKDEFEAHNSRDLVNLESKIVKTILPVKARLHERWMQQKNDEANTGAGSKSTLSSEAQPKSSFSPATSSSSTAKQAKPVKVKKEKSEKEKEKEKEPSSKATRKTKKPSSNSSLSDSSINMPTRQSISNSSQASLTEAMAGLKTTGARNSENSAMSMKDLPPPLRNFTLPSVSSAENLTILKNSGAFYNHYNASPSSTYDQARSLSVGDAMEAQFQPQPPFPTNVHRNNTENSAENAFPQRNFTLPVGPLKFNKQATLEPEACHPLAVKNEDGTLTQFFTMEPVEDGELHENIFDNMSDCGVDLYDEDLDQIVISTFPELQHSVDMDSVGGKRSYSNSFSNAMELKRDINKPPGPYYSSAVDLDLKSSFAMGTTVTREDEYMSSRRRRRLNQIVPNPRKPRQAEYQCSVCSEGYELTVHDNPWWCVYRHECPHCKQVQIPRIDISLPSNAIEIDPNVVALYGEGVEDSGDDSLSDEYSDEEEGEEDDSPTDEAGDNSLEEAKSNEGEDVMFDGEGLLAKEEASKLLVLMCHARTCDGFHASDKHAEICKSTKFLMLHIRDCKGNDNNGRDCAFPWCQPCKKMLKHLIQCYEPNNCSVCNPWGLPESFQQLRKLNEMQFCQVATSPNSMENESMVPTPAIPEAIGATS